MLKFLYRGIILLCIFAGAFFYFSKDMKEEIPEMQQTIKMDKTTFPILTIRLGDEYLNVLHGYSNNLNANMVRESITPIDSNQNIDAVIDGKGNDVKRVIYELRNVSDNKLIETNTINALEKEGELKTARIKFKETLAENTEYAVKITLITSESKKMNYYTRVKKIDEVYFKEKIDFVMDFHNSIMDKEKAQDIIAYLEPQSSADNASLAYVDIHSSFDLISWGNLKPQVKGEIVPIINEINTDTASVSLNYIISGETDTGEELYSVKEFYRVRYTATRMYLLNYERTTEAYFNPALASLSKSEFKVGITNDIDTKLFVSSDRNKLSFVRQKELWLYNLSENKMVNVFTFRQKDTDYIRDTYSEHDVRILNMDDEGNIDFMVYGYMNRGVYEGRVCIVFYKYFIGEDRIEEVLYIPMDITYELLKEEIENFSYVNKQNVFYFNFKNTIYSYNLITKNLSTIASDISSDNYIVSVAKHYIAWEDNKDGRETTSINILDLETGEQDKITANNGDRINLLGEIDNNIIYGYAKAADISKAEDGSLLIPMYKIEIANSQAIILKEYKKAGYYVTGTSVDNNVITLERVKKTDQGQYESTSTDNILNKVSQTSEAFEITKRITEKFLTEYYISLPSGFIMKELPKTDTTVNTIIKADTTLRLEDVIDVSATYTVYAHGGVEGIYENLGTAITIADEKVGVVVNHNGVIVWERGIKSLQKEISDIEPIYTGNSRTDCASMVLKHKSGYAMSNLGEDSVYDILDKEIPESVLNLTRCTLDQVLYYVNKGIPVIGMKDKKNAVLIIGFDMYNITVIDPSQQRTMKIGLNDSKTLFEGAGNMFFSYLSE